MRSTKDLLKEGFASLPNTFAYREVRFYLHQAMQKLEKLEKREAIREKQNEEDRIALEEKKKLQPWQPPIYRNQNAFAVQQTIDILDQMIADENKVIENIQNKKNKGQINKNEYPNEDEQTLHG